MQVLKFLSDDGNRYFGCEYDGDTAAVLEGKLFQGFSRTDSRMPVKQILAPVAPAAIFCIGLNYKAHAAETGMELPRYPTVFMKNPGAIAAHHGDIQIPKSCLDVPEVDYEAELAVVLGRRVKNVSPEDALDAVFGYTCANDVSARRWQKHAGNGQWIKGKSFDTFCPIGPWLVTPDEIGDPQDLDIECGLNGKIMQKGNTGQMIFSVAQVISFLSQSATLLPGTLILTGTPEGVGFTRKPPVYLKPGDILETKIEKIGVLENRVIAENPGQPQGLSRE